MDWKKLDKVEDLDALIQASFTKDIIIFKHSTSCGISRMVLRNFEADIFRTSPEHLSFYFLDLLRYRSISNLISEKFAVRHESPQVLHISKGIVLNHSSHSDIHLSAFM